MRIGKPRHQDEEQPLTGQRKRNRKENRIGKKNLKLSRAKGTTAEPFDGGAFTLEVLAHAGKGPARVPSSSSQESLRRGRQTPTLA